MGWFAHPRTWRTVQLCGIIGPEQGDDPTPHFNSSQPAGLPPSRVRVGAAGAVRLCVGAEVQAVALRSAARDLAPHARGQAAASRKRAESDFARGGRAARRKSRRPRGAEHPDARAFHIGSCEVAARVRRLGAEKRACSYRRSQWPMGSVLRSSSAAHPLIYI